MPKYSINANSKSNRCLSMIYNKDSGAVLGRTPLDWGRLFVYYVAFYVLLGALFFGQLYVVMNYIITNHIPYRSGENSLLELNPGISSWPNLDLGSKMIVSSTNKSSHLYQAYVKSRKQALDDFFMENAISPNDCDSQMNRKSTDDITVPCRFDRSLLGSCSDPEINNGTFCVYWKINRIFGYIPDIESTTFADAILLKCEGQSNIDNDNAGEPVYFPSHVAQDGKSYGKFSHSFFPFINQPGFQNQLVAVHFPHMRNNVAVHIKCKLINLKKESTPATVEMSISNA